MPPQITFKGYVLSVMDERRICVRVDSEDFEMVSNRLTNIYDKTIANDTLMVNVNDCRFRISIEWKELPDLVGVHVKIVASLRRYNFYKPKVIQDEENRSRTIMIQCKGVSILAKQISNET